MVRYTFGGDIHDLIARPDATAGGALKLAPNTTVPFYSVPTGGSVLTDYLVDTNGDNTFPTVATSIVSRSTGYLPSFKGPDGFDVLYYDPDPNDSDVQRVRIVARDQATASTPDASRTGKGVVKYANDTELDAAAAGAQAVDPAGLRRAVLAHEGASNPHPGIASSIAALQSSVGGKVSTVNGQAPDGTGNVNLTLDLADPARTTNLLDASSKLANLDVAVGQLISPSPDPNGSTYVVRRANGAGAGASATNPDEWVTLQQATSLGGTTGGGAVTSPRATGVPLASNTDGTFKAAPAQLSLSGAKSLERYRCTLWVVFRGLAIRWQTSNAVAALTNRLANGTFNGGVTGWNITNGTVTPETTTVAEGTGAARVVASSAGTMSFYSDWIAGVTAGEVNSAAAEVRRVTATSRAVRVDVQYGDATATNAALVTGVLATGLGVQAQPGTTAFSRLISDSANRGGGSGAAPAGAAQVRIRVSFLQVAVGDTFIVDKAQVESGDPIVAWGNTGGGSNTLDWLGNFEGLPSTGAVTAPSPTVAGTPYVRTTIRSGGNNPTPALTAQGFGTSTDAEISAVLDVAIGGSGLTNQTVSWEFASTGTTGAPATTTIMAAWATWAKVA